MSHSTDVLFVGEDPGGVDVIVPIHKRLAAAGLRLQVLASGPGTAVWQRASVEYRDISSFFSEETSGAVALDLLKEARPRVLVTSTSYPRRVEKVFRREARGLSVPSVCVLDADRENLYEPGADEAACRGDVTLSISEAMTDKLVAAGYPSVLTTGHLALGNVAAAGLALTEEEKANWKARFRKTHDGRPLIVVFSENITDVFGAGGAIAKLGFHEGIVVPALLEMFDQISARSNKRYEVVIKLHPKETPGMFTADIARFSSERLAVHQVTDADNIQLILAADHIFGLYSIVMVWAAALGRLSLSYQPHAKTKALLATVAQGITPCCWDPGTLDRDVARFLLDSAFVSDWQQRLNAWKPRSDGIDQAVAEIRRLMH